MVYSFHSEIIKDKQYFCYLARMETRENYTKKIEGEYYNGPLYSDIKARFAGTCPKSRISVLVKLRGTEVRPPSLKDR